MKLVFVNPPHPAIGSRIPVEHLPPLGLLMVAGPLVDAGFEVSLLDAEFGPMPVPEIVRDVRSRNPDVILIGHSGSTSGHSSVVQVTRALHEAMPEASIIYGGVYPTYHWEEILRDEPQISFVVRGEGETTALALLKALAAGQSREELAAIPGVACRLAGKSVAAPEAPIIDDLNALRVPWELIDLKRYQYWGERRAVVVQFSRGCVHGCRYCGQREFWRTWRHRDPVAFARELAWLHRVHGVEVINFADENPTTSREAWRQFLQALIAEQVPLILVGSVRADDIVRDADLLPLYKKAGFERFLLGIENYTPRTLKVIRKGGSMETDRRAIALLRQNGILSMATYAVGFEEETITDYLQGLKRFLSYDPDQIQMMYAVPHRWTAFGREQEDRQVVQSDLSCWDYKHQVLENRYMSPWQVFWGAKLIEAVVQLRPRALWRVIGDYDASLRAAMRWYFNIGRRVWFHEIFSFLRRSLRRRPSPTLREFWAAPNRSLDENDSLKS
jgi:anaerobic magnesium-protoporphyrin IX monomethyl ester cyclase